jgi:hypothetical protein
LNFWNNEISAILLTDTGSFRNPFIHTEDDTADHLDYVRLAALVRGLHGAILELTANPTFSETHITQ